MELTVELSHYFFLINYVYFLLAINAIPNTQKFWSDRKSRFTDILDPKKDTIKHDCFWLKKRYNKTRLFLRKNKVVVFFLSVCWLCFIVKYWLLGIGYWVIWVLGIECQIHRNFSNAQSGKKVWVLGIGYWVLGIEQFTVIFQYQVSQKHRLYQFFSNTQYPKFKDRPGKQPFDC